MSFCHIWSPRAPGGAARAQMVSSQSAVSDIPARTHRARLARWTGGWAESGVIYSSGHIPSLMHVGPQRHKRSPYLALFTEFANCYSSLTRGMKTIPEECGGRALLAVNSLPRSLPLPPPAPLFLYCPRSLSSAGLLQWGPLCPHSSFVPGRGPLLPCTPQAAGCR